jgi:hypothetical protein
LILTHELDHPARSSQGTIRPRAAFTIGAATKRDNYVADTTFSCCTNLGAPVERGRVRARRRRGWRRWWWRCRLVVLEEELAQAAVARLAAAVQARRQVQVRPTREIQERWEAAPILTRHEHEPEFKYDDQSERSKQHEQAESPALSGSSPSRLLRSRGWPFRWATLACWRGPA